MIVKSVIRTIWSILSLFAAIILTIYQFLRNFDGYGTMDESKLRGISSCYGVLHFNPQLYEKWDEGDEDLAHAVYSFLVQYNEEELRDHPEPVMWDGEWDDEEEEAA